MVVGTIGAGVPEEVLVAAGVDIVRISGAPGAPTDVADRYLEPMVGERARSQLQRVLDGTYRAVELLVCSREEDAPLRLFYALREIRRLEPERRLPRLHLVDLQHLGTEATRRWNVRCVRELCAVLGVDDAALADGVRACNRRRSIPNGADGGGRRVYLTGSEHAETELAAAVEAAGARVVAGRPVLADEALPPVEAVARRYEHPMLARARGSSAARAAAPAEDAATVGADVVLAFYLEGDDGLRWEYPELRDACNGRGIPVVLLDHQRYELRGVELHV